MGSYRICPYCVAQRGIKGFELKERDLSNDEDFANHLEEEHGIIVKRKGETEKQARARCAKKGIISDENKCNCTDCRTKRVKL
jgi:hypothetical protein